MTRPRAAGGTILAVLLATHSTFAQPRSPTAVPPAPAPAPAVAPTPAPAPAPTPLSDSLQGAAKQAYEAAKLLAQNRDFGGALDEFRQAYSLSKDPRLLFNMAICEKELHHYALMKTTLEQYVRDAGAAMTPETHASVDEAIGAIRPLVASVRLVVNEPGATVSVDGEAVGTTPLAAPITVDFGRHQLSVKKAGFDALDETVETPGGTETVLSRSLAAQTHVGRLVVSADPEATVAIDGSTMGLGRFDGSLASGSHHVTVTAPDKLPYRSEVVLRDGETQTLQVTLEAQSHGGSAWPWIIGGVVIAAGAATGGYFLFKPADTTTPVPPGKLTTVQLNAWRP